MKKGAGAPQLDDNAELTRLLRKPQMLGARRRLERSVVGPT